MERIASVALVGPLTLLPLLPLPLPLPVLLPVEELTEDLVGSGSDMTGASGQPHVESFVAF